jgi:hypothetical protein
LLNLHPRDDVQKENVRLTFRRTGEDTLLCSSGLGEGEFTPQDILDLSGQPVQRRLLVCPTGEITSNWYQQAEDQPNIKLGDLEFGVIFSAKPFHSEAGYSIDGKIQRLGGMIIVSLKVLQI